MPKAPPPKPLAEQAAPPAPSGKRRKPEAAFDLWLHRGLHELYDTVAREPVPEELLRLIEEDRKK